MNRAYDLIRSASGDTGSAGGSPGSDTRGLDSARQLHRQLTGIYTVIQGADATPSTSAVRQAEELLQQAEAIGSL